MGSVTNGTKLFHMMLAISNGAVLAAVSRLKLLGNGSVATVRVSAAVQLLDEGAVCADAGRVAEAEETNSTSAIKTAAPLNPTAFIVVVSSTLVNNSITRMALTGILGYGARASGTYGPK